METSDDDRDPFEPYAGEALGPYLRRLREMRGMSQTTLAEHIGTSREYVAQIEGGRIRYPKSLAGKFADVLDVRPSWIGRTAGRIVPDEPPKRGVERPRPQVIPSELVKLWWQLDPADRAFALSWLRRMARPAADAEPAETPETDAANGAARS